MKVCNFHFHSFCQILKKYDWSIDCFRTTSNFGFGTKAWFQEVGSCIAWGLLRHLVDHHKVRG